MRESHQSPKLICGFTAIKQQSYLNHLYQLPEEKNHKKARGKSRRKPKGRILSAICARTHLLMLLLQLQFHHHG